MKSRELEEKVRRLPGVEGVRVVVEGDDVTEVHVLATNGKPAKQVVRDVQSLAQAAFGTAIDRRVVSVVQLPEADLAGGDRPMIEDVAERIDGSRMTATVTLAWHGEQIVGEAEGAASANTRLRLVAEATLDALRRALKEATAFDIVSVDVPTLGGRPIAIAQVVMVADGIERLMVGSALSGVESPRSVVRAVLDALNRHIPELRR
ncbi:MAG TPA: hypothetical protein VID03_02445 [Acidimicrobiia bacterium]|jgi:hypothetical protein